VPSAVSVADVTVREGPTATGILDPSGAASVGISGIRDIVRASTPGHPHYGDLFVTGFNSHSVARFDWASQTYQPFVAPNSGGLGGARGITLGPDGNVYVTDRPANTVFRYDGATGAPLPAPGQTGAVYVAAGSGGLSVAYDVIFGPTGNLLVASGSTNQILEYQGPSGLRPGEFVGVFVSITNGSSPSMLTFGPDGNLYVSLTNGGLTPATAYGQVNRYDGVTGAPVGTGVFVSRGSGGLIQPAEFVFDEQGTNMYVTHGLIANEYGAQPGPMGQVLRYQGPNGQNPGAYVEAFITGGQAGLSIPHGLARDADGNLYVSDRETANVTRFAPTSRASFVVTLDAASASPVSVDYATANGTALAGSDYTPTTGTLTFAPGETSRTVSVPITDDLAGEPTETFRLTLSNAENATLARSQATGTVLDNETKFFVVDSGTVKTYQYGSGGTSEEITVPQLTSNTAPRGVATTAAGTTVWVVDANRIVYIYDNHGVLQGSWTAGGLPPNAAVEGIATNGTDIWLLANSNSKDKVFKYLGGPNAGANRRFGSQSAASSFKLANGNTTPKDIVTDGASIWIVDDGTTDKVFKYTVAGSSLGSWSIDPANSHPTGLTINPANVSDIWIVDNGTRKVYQYTAAAGRTSGSQNAAATFALNPYNTNPQGIADPPPADMLLTPAAAPLGADFPVHVSLTTTDPSLALLLAPTGPTAPAVSDGSSQGKAESLPVAPDVLGSVSTGVPAAETPPPLPRSPATGMLDRLFADLLNNGVRDGLGADDWW
jgi:sugar lactone lactonase YvrE